MSLNIKSQEAHRLAAELGETLRRLHPQPLTLVLTNSSSRPMRERCMALGAHHFFDKSNEFDQVATALDALRPPP